MGAWMVNRCVEHLHECCGPVEWRWQAPEGAEHVSRASQGLVTIWLQFGRAEWRELVLLPGWLLWTLIQIPACGLGVSQSQHLHRSSEEPLPS
jgi:hypothetical protein